LILALLLACAGGDSVAPTAGPCDDAAVVTWNNFGEAFILHNCQACHASTTADRYGAPESVTFDTKSEVWAQAASILSVATGDAPSMPPRGGVSDDDRQRLVWWLTCAEPGT
jgi:uncharacterized membrane protein